MSAGAKNSKSTTKSFSKKNSNIDLNPPKKNRISYEKQLPLEDFTAENHKKLLQYICPLCNGVLVEPLMDQKGHMFCDKCLTLYEQNNSTKHKKLECPVSNHVLKMGNLKPNELINNYLKEMMCFCPNKKKGCKWEGKYYLRNKHIEKECEFIDAELCHNEGCGKIIKTENIKNHLEKECDFRKTTCEKCKKVITFKEKEKHEGECGKEEEKKNKKILCKKCGLGITADQMEKHVSEECPEFEINCDFFVFGCKEKFLRKNKYNHFFEDNQINSHNRILINWVSGFKTNLENKFSKIENTLKENRIKMNFYKKYLTND